MSLFTQKQQRFAHNISSLVFGNPFIPERIAFEKEALGDQFIQTPRVWSFLSGSESDRANLSKLVELVIPLADEARKKLASGIATNENELGLYHDLVLYLLYQHDRMQLHQTIVEALQGKGSTGQIQYYKGFKSLFDHYLKIPGITMPVENEPAHIFALCFQIRRAFYHIFSAIVGGSMPIARLRAAIWQSIFTHDMRRYIRLLYKSMEDFTTLVTGPSGTGKELVARAIGQSRYIPFDEKTLRFADDFSSSFHALNLSALSPSLIESELFGHKRGTFTGAIADRAGWLEVCGPLDTVFLDEIGELDATIQVKLLRALQTRTFQRLGETKDRIFHGKIIAATNVDLAVEIDQGSFRTDFYYRLCSDIITTPSLQEQLADDPDDLYNLILFIAKTSVGDEAESLAEEVTAWIKKNLGKDYPWTGNFRELEQCTRNVLIRKTYKPAHGISDKKSADVIDDLTDSFKNCELTADQLLRAYCTIAYCKSGSYEKAARLLEIDRRTVRSKVDNNLLEQLD